MTPNDVQRIKQRVADLWYDVLVFEETAAFCAREGQAVDVRIARDCTRDADRNRVRIAHLLRWIESER